MSPNHDPAAQKNKNALNKLARKNMLRRTALRKELRASDNRYQHLIHSINGILWEADASTLRCSFVSQQAERILGYPLECWINEPTFWGDHIHPADQEWVVAYCLACTGEMIPHEFEYRMIAADGRTVWLHDSITVMSQANQPRTLYGVMVDITERKQAEEALQQAQEERKILLDTIEGIVWEADANTFIFSYVNQQAERLLGYPIERWTSEPTFWKDHIHPDDQGWAVDYCVAQTQAQTAHEFEYRMIAADGHIVWLRDIVAVISENDQPIKLRGIMVDITERKRAEQALQESERRFRALIEHGTDQISLLGADGTLLYENPTAANPLGYPLGAFLGRNLFELTHPDDLARASQIWAELLNHPGLSLPSAFRLRHADGSWRWMEGTATNLLDEPAVQAIVINYRDVSERQQAEEALRVSEKKYRDIYDNVSDVIYETDNHGQITSISPSAERHTGYRPAELIGCNVVDFFVQPERYAALDTQLIEHGAVNDFEALLRRKNGDTVFVSITAHIVFDETGQAIATAGVLRDITARKQAEEQLVQSEERYRTLVKNSPYCIHEINLDGNLLSMNPAGLQMMGVESQEDVVGTPYLNAVSAMDKPRIDGLMQEAMHGEVNLFEFVAEGGSNFHSNFVPLYDKSGQVMRLMGITEDITERKQAEDALRESEQRLQLATRAGNIGVWDWDIANDKLVWDDNSYSLYGIRKEDFGNVYDAWLKTLHPDDRDYTDVEVQAALRGEREYAPEFRIIRRDGEIRVMRSASQTLYDENGKARRMIGVSIDITERKQIEQALANERNLLRTLIDNLPDAIYVKDSEGRFLLKNHADARRMGAASPEETIGKTDFDYYPAALAAHYQADDQAVMHSGQAIINQEEPVIDAANRAGWVSTTKLPLRDQQGRVIGLVGIRHDITAQKQADEEKAKLEAQLYQAYKMESVGRLVGGVAHDFNNMLGVILV